MGGGGGGGGGRGRWRGDHLGEILGISRYVHTAIVTISLSRHADGDTRHGTGVDARYQLAAG